MKTWGQIRIGAFALTAVFLYFCLFSGAISRALGIYTFFCAINIILYSHYAMSFVASRKTIFKMLRFTRGQIVLGALFALAATSNWIEPELGYFYFGVHFALSETYSRFLLDRDGGFYSNQQSDFRAFRFWHLLFMLSVYFYASSHTVGYIQTFDFIHQAVPPALYGAILLWTTLTYFGFLFINAKTLFPKSDRNAIFLSYVAPELGFLALAIFCHALMIHWSIFVFYHITFWLVTPLFTRSSLSNTRAWLTYALPTAILICLAYVAFPAFGPAAGSVPSQYTTAGTELPFYGFDFQIINPQVIRAFQVSLIWGNFHILFSLAVSVLNPAAVRRTVSRNGHDPLAMAPAV